MRAAVVSAPGIWSVEEVPDPTPGPMEVVVEVDRCGVCGTDLHVLAGEHASALFPVIPGHEFSGRVVALGEGVREPGLGTLVAVDPMVFCGHCRECRSGWTNLCANGGGLGTTSDGAFARYVAVAAAQCEPVPDAVPPEWAALTEPLACVVHGMDRIGPVVGADALVLGAGPIGLLMTGMLVLGGARVDVVERRPDRLAVASAFGAARTAKDVAELDGPGGQAPEGDRDGWQVVVDATGNAASLQAALELVRRAGTFAVFGVPAAAATVVWSPYRIFSHELTIVGSNSVRNSFGRALAVLASGAIPAAELLDKPVPLEGIETAFRRTREGTGLKSTVAPERGLDR